MRTAIVTDPLFVYAGAEKVIEQMFALFPDADVFAVVDFLNPEDRHFLRAKPVRTSFIQRMPAARRHFRKYLNLWPLAIEQLDLRAYDIILSSHNAVAHGVRTGPSQIHICFTHSPMRYAWDLQEEYLEGSRFGRLADAWARYVLHRLRLWDVSAAQRPDFFMANSQFVAARIRKLYRREARVVYPPVAVESFSLNESKSDYFITAGRLVAYKRVDLILQAFAGTKDRMIVVGDGPEYKSLKRFECDNIEFKGRVDHDELNRLVGGARAFVFAGIEDFGIAPVEAQAAGTPVIAYAAGGLKETVRGLEAERPTGLFFEAQTADAIRGAIDLFKSCAHVFTAQACRENAMRFNEREFTRGLRLEIEGFIAEKGEQTRFCAR